jgi:hypothetical protein
MNLLAIVVALAQTQAPSGDAVPPPEDAPVVAKPWRPQRLRVDGAYGARRLFLIATPGADIGVAAGSSPNERRAYWVEARAFIGGTENGLPVWDVRVSGEAEYVRDRLRIGAAAGLFVIGVGRAARDETLVSWGPSVRVIARGDVVRAGDHTVFVSGAFGVGYGIFDGAVPWGPSLGVGVDFDISGHRAR